MTIYELWLLIKRRWALVVGIPVVAVLVCGGFLLLKYSAGSIASFQSQVDIIANSQIETVFGIASEECDRMNKSGDIDSAEAKVALDKMTVTLTVSAKSESAGIEAVEMIAQNTLDRATDLMADYSDSGNSVRFSAQISSPVTLQNSESLGGKAVKYLIVSVGGGLIIALLLLIFINAIKRPVITADEIEDLVGLPVIAKYQDESFKERLLASTLFALDSDNGDTVCIVPVSSKQSADITEQYLIQEKEKNNDDAFFANRFNSTEVIKIKSFASPIECADSIYGAHAAAVTLISVCQWDDSLRMLKEIKEALINADANLIGAVLLPEEKKLPDGVATHR